MFEVLFKPSGVTRETKLWLVENLIFEWEKMIMVQMLKIEFDPRERIIEKSNILTQP